MEHTKQIIKNYLENDSTDYAILINGEWGSGKTFFWENTLEPMIRSTPSKITGENYIPVYVSLYGISNTEEIQSQLLYQLLPDIIKKIGNNKVVKSVSSLSRNLLNTLTRANYKIGSETFFQDVSLDMIFDISHNKHVLCFDDLERIDKSLNISRVLGFINTFVEHDHVKTILIANEKELYEMEDNNYKKIKEKVIGRIIKFELNEQEIIEGFLSENWITDSFKTFLETHKENIIKLFKIGGRNNLRSLKHSLDSLSEIFRYLKNEIKSYEGLGEEILIYTLMLTFEFKAGTIISQKDLDYISNETHINTGASLFNDELKDEESEYYKTCKEVRKYYNQFCRYRYLDNIAKYILFGYLYEAPLKNEIIHLYSPANYSEEIILRNQINNFMFMENDAFKVFSDKLIEKIEKGELKLYSYTFFANSLFELSNEKLITFEPEELIEKFLKGIKTIKKNNNNLISEEGDDFSFRYFTTKNNTENIIKSIENIEEAVNQVYQHFYEKSIKDEMDTLVSNLSINYKVFMEKILYDQTYKTMPLIKFVDLQKIFDYFISLDNRDLASFTHSLIWKYKKYKEYLKEDYQFLNSLKIKLDEHISKINSEFKTVELYNFEVFMNGLNEICEYYEKQEENSNLNE